MQDKTITKLNCSKDRSQNLKYTTRYATIKTVFHIFPSFS